MLTTTVNLEIIEIYLTFMVVLVVSLCEAVVCMLTWKPEIEPSVSWNLDCGNDNLNSKYFIWSAEVVYTD